MSIQQRQNEDSSVRRLASQRLLYSRAKLVRNIDLCLIFAISLLGLSSVALEFLKIDQWIPLIALSYLLLAQFLLKRLERNRKIEAAIIQEEFDCYVLDLAWPEHKGIERPSLDRIGQLSQEYFDESNDSSALTNWYTPDETSPGTFQAIIQCQKMNCWWDLNLRRKWKNLLLLGLVLFVFSAVVIAFVFRLTVPSFIALLASFLALLHWVLLETLAQERSGKTIKKLHKYIESLSAREQISSSALRSIQDEIFENRCRSSLVPDWIYWWHRDSQESKAEGS